ncbi:MAG: glycoside hydrolase family 15 protein [Alphaproteobacteria bacterium]|nr:glycoside hydrolase family 15 protein [Alphaproteobacteria bacterium]
MAPGPGTNAGTYRAACDDTYQPIEEYAAIGDGRSVALISGTGSIDWLCLPHFSAPPLFSALLDWRQGGRFALRPAAPFRMRRRYIPDTNVLESRFETETGAVRVTECMALLPDRMQHDTLRPQAEILRLVECLEGDVTLEVVCTPRPDFARAAGHFEDRGAFGWAYCWSDSVFFLRGELPLACDDGNTVRGNTRMTAGDMFCISLAYTRRDIAVVPALGAAAVERVAETRNWWQSWTDVCTFKGTYRDPVVRSALVLKLLHYDLSGALVAAPTTSLPEVIGGIRNWDYRYCWLRDAAMTVQAFAELGYTREADFFIDWLLHATRLTWPRLDVLYDVYGETHLPESEVKGFEGYRKSAPVRVGNDAQNQLQLDVYGAVIEAAYLFVKYGGSLDHDAARALKGFGEQVCKLWREPDEGIWEKRDGRAHHTYSKMMAWVALDRLLKLADMGHMRVPATRFETERGEIEEAIETRGFNQALNSYVACFGGEEPDAALLLASRYGYRPADHPRMQGTCAYIERTLGIDGLVYRYPPGTDGLPGKEGAFGIAGFWMVEHLALAGRVAEAQRRFEDLLARSCELGLYAEETDPDTGQALGNFPQAFTHVGLITAAMALRRAAAAKQTSESHDDH